jgi:PAS domain S-box-containing protein
MHERFPEGLVRRLEANFRPLGAAAAEDAVAESVEKVLALGFDAQRTDAHTCFVAGLKGITGDVEGALERVRVPAYVIDRHGVIVWINPAAERLLGNVRGRQMTTALAPEERSRGREIFTRNLLGPREGSDNRGVLLDAQGERFTAELSAVPLEDGGHVIGVFGQVKDVQEEAPPPPHPHLTPRQSQVMRLLMDGRSTVQIAAELHLSQETVRNHVRHILRALGVHSRLEAVAVAQRALSAR